ncbi:uncharacterized protein [Panulirus ornatus]|uniref:uncharacterized protein n=1 Tax=Panulirus ornatus TaxID=150431 RepID=UPI003A85B8DD
MAGILPLRPDSIASIKEDLEDDTSLFSHLQKSSVGLIFDLTTPRRIGSKGQEAISVEDRTVVPENRALVLKDHKICLSLGKTSSLLKVFYPVAWRLPVRTGLMFIHLSGRRRTYHCQCELVHQGRVRDQLQGNDGAAGHVLPHVVGGASSVGGRRCKSGGGLGDGMLMPLHSSLMKQLWVPDLYIHEARDITSFSMIQDVQGVYLNPPNTILFSTLLQTRLACPMFFAKYPFDVQECPMTVSSYNFGVEDLRLEWMPLGVTANPSIDHQLPNYDFHIEWANITTKIWCTNCTFTPTSIGQARIVLARRYTLHVLTVYVPSALFVAVAWASFFWPPEVIPGRTVLIITSLLTVISMYAAIGQKSPETSYLKAVDVWLFICIVLVVLTLFQYAIVITRMQARHLRLSLRAPLPEKTICSPPVPSPNHAGWLSQRRPISWVKLTSLLPSMLRRKQKERTVEVFPMKNCYPRQNTSTAGGVGPTRQNSADSPATSPPSTAVDGPAAAYKTGGSQSPHRLVLYEQWTERAGKVGIPIIFLICNIVYWSTYLVEHV